MRERGGDYGESVFYGCSSDFTVCYTAGSTGFTTPTWYGYPAAVCEETTSSTTSVPPPTTTSILSDSGYTFAAAWGSPTTGNGQFNYPYDVAVDSSGNVYVADTYNQQIQKFSSANTYVTQWGSPVSGNGQFNTPFAVAADTSGNVYVADSGNNRIQKFSSTGTYITQWGSLGSDNGQFINPFGIAVDTSGNVYVADTDNQRIQKFTPVVTITTTTTASPRPPSCFPAGTQILMADTSQKPIEEIQAGDMVMGYDGKQNVPVEVLELESPVRDHILTGCCPNPTQRSVKL